MFLGGFLIYTREYPISLDTFVFMNLAIGDRIIFYVLTYDRSMLN